MICHAYKSVLVFLYLVTILFLAACGGAEEVLEEGAVAVDGLLITGTVIDNSDTPDPFVPLTIYIANFSVSPNILIKRES